MNQSVILYGRGPKDILKTSIESNASASMSYLLRGKWCSTKIRLTGMGTNAMHVEVAAGKTMLPVHMQANHVVSVLIKYGRMKLVFDTRVLWVVPSLSSAESKAMVLAVPNQIQLIDNRKSSRVAVPANLHVNMRMWRLCHVPENGHIASEHCWKCRLVDISPRGAQVAFSTVQEPDFRKGEHIGVRFTPAAHEMPLILDADVKNIVSTADEKHISLGLAFVGLETSSEGQQVLQRLHRLVQWYELNQCQAEPQEALTTAVASDPALV